MISFYFIITFAFVVTFVTNRTEPSSCKADQFYDINTYECKACPANQVVAKNKFSCDCAPNAIKKIEANTSSSILGSISKTITCVACSNGQVANREKTKCMTCPKGISSTNGDCQCESGFAIQEKDSDGNYLDGKICLQCPEGQYQGNTPNIPVYECAKCPENKIYNKNTIPWKCECDVTNYIEYGGECLDKIEANFLNSEFATAAASSILMSDAETINPFVLTQETISESDTIQYFYLKSAFKCLKEQDNKSCQILANICVLQLYDLQTVPCQLYKFINDKQEAIKNQNLGARKNMPWLYYSGNSTEILNNTERIKLTPSFDPKDPLYVNKMDFYIASYDYEGNYFGMKRLTNELNLCSNDLEDNLEYMRFGNSADIACEIDFYHFLRSNYTSYFYELFLYDPSSKEFIDIPIMIVNAKNGNDGWKRNNETSPSEWLLTRRFFTVDNLAGIEGKGNYFNIDSIPKAIRYPHIFKFKITLQNRQDARIYLPYVEIYYKTKRFVDMSEIPTSLAMFQVAYLMDTSYLLYVFKSIFITLNVVIGIHILLKMYSWYQLNPPELSRVRNIII